jgi:hypothetical protein
VDGNAIRVTAWRRLCRRGDQDEGEEAKKYQGDVTARVWGRATRPLFFAGRQRKTGTGDGC